MLRPARWLRHALGVSMLAALSTPSYGWGRKGHEVVNSAAANLMQSSAASFFQRNDAALKRLANTPDGLWKRQHHEEERPTHFFHWDRFSNSSSARDLDSISLDQVVQRLGRDYVEENGSAIWRITGLYKKLVTSLRGRDWTRSLQMAGVLGHYVGDMSQPMHASSDYDGQSIGRSGVHGYFETRLVDDVDAVDLLADVQRDGSDWRGVLNRQTRRVEYSRFVRQVAIAEGRESISSMDEVMSHFDRDGQDDGALKEFFGPRMGHGAAVLAKIWDLAVEESGIVDGYPSQALQVSEPEFVPVDGASATD